MVLLHENNFRKQTPTAGPGIAGSLVSCGVTKKKFFSSIPKDLRKTIRVVCTDMYEGFVNAAKEVLGKKVRIVVDRFHVAKLYRQGLEEVRKKELKRLKEELPKEQYQEFKGAIYGYCAKTQVAWNLMNRRC